MIFIWLVMSIGVMQVQEWLVKLFGFFLSGAAVAQGAPFWFDALKKLVELRSQPTQESK
jgi:hypothetical protein